MNRPDAPTQPSLDIDFAAYEQQARLLRDQAIRGAFRRVGQALRALVARLGHRPPQHRAPQRRPLGI